jgi:NAD kinase
MAKIVCVLKDESVLTSYAGTFARLKDNHSVIHHLRDELHYTKLQDADLVIVFGGDGTLFSTTHYMKAGLILGVNCGTKGFFLNEFPEHHLGFASFKNNKEDPLVDAVDDILLNEKPYNYQILAYPRLSCRVFSATGREYRIDRAFNDYAVGNDLYGRPSKYTILGEHQRSSGIIVSTLHGLGGWVKHIVSDGAYKEIRDDYIEHAQEEKFFFIVREPMDDYKYSLGFSNSLEIDIDMAGGLVSLDGFNQFPVSRGDKVLIKQSKYPILTAKRKGGK